MGGKEGMEAPGAAGGGGGGVDAAALRQRNVVPANPSSTSASSTPKAPRPEQPGRREDAHDTPVWLDGLRFLALIVLLSTLLSYLITNTLFWSATPPSLTHAYAKFQRWRAGDLLLTEEQLRAYDGSDPTKPIYLAINGSVFDVSANPLSYGPGGSYHFFAGRDATRAFVTGCFAADLTGDLRGVEEMFLPLEDPEEDARLGVTKAQKKVRREREMREARRQVRDAVQHWEKFFRNSKKYFYVGKVVGQDFSGEKWPLCEKAAGLRKKRGEKDKDKDG